MIDMPWHAAHRRVWALAARTTIYARDKLGIELLCCRGVRRVLLVKPT